LREFHRYSSVTGAIALTLACLPKDFQLLSEDNQIIYYTLQSCRGCRLNRLPEVKKFIFEDVPLLYP